MTITRRIFVSSPRDDHLDEDRNKLKWAIVDKIEQLGYEAQAFGSTRGELIAGKTWNPERACDVMRRCVGAAILGFPIGKCSPAKGGETFPVVTEYCHYEGAIARAYGLPILAVLEDGAGERGFFNRHAGDLPIKYPVPADPAWVETQGFMDFLESWNSRLEKERMDVFLGYCSKGKMAAQAIHLFLTKELNLTVWDWEMDFTGGSSIIDEIERAATRCTGGIFLFTKDDELEDGDTTQAAPRDNVVYESGYFMRSKGKERVLIIREDGAKMPADIQGTIYAALPNQQSTASVEGKIRGFIETQL